MIAKEKLRIQNIFDQVATQSGKLENSETDNGNPQLTDAQRIKTVTTGEIPPEVLAHMDIVSGRDPADRVKPKKRVHKSKLLNLARTQDLEFFDSLLNSDERIILSIESNWTKEGVLLKFVVYSEYAKETQEENL